ncbi:MAG: transporter [Verrucomicrobiales bacterium]|nr:transporter [Verrucomicrobiales bacterium]
MAVIEVNQLTRTFRTFKKKPGLAGAIRGLFHREYEEVSAVKNVSFKVEEGEFVGFLGPNGAGKTTTLKMLAGLLYPSSGTARVLGYNPWERKDGYRRQFALLLGQKNQLWWDLPAYESLLLNSKIYDLAPKEFEKSVQEMSEMLNVKDKLNVNVRELSLGERMKMELIAALLHKPRVLFLDEPTIGLDVVSQKTVREFLKEHNRIRKTTIVLTSHYMADIEELCNRVVIIDKGKLFFDGELSQIMDRFADSKRITIQYDPLTEAAENEVGRVAEMVGTVIEKKAGLLKVQVARERAIQACKTLLDAVPAKDIDIQEVPIEEVIRGIFSGETDVTSNPGS